MNSAAIEQFVSMKEAQKRFCVCRQTIYRWAWSGELPTIKIGGRRLVGVGVLRAKLKAQKEASE